MSGSPPREELLHNAVLFLNDPQVQTSSLASKITFLEGKGLNEDEIQEALRRARSGHSGGASSAPVAGPSRGYTQTQAGYGYEQGFGQRMMPPEVPKRDWRDLFIMTVISGGVVYGMSVLAKKYLLPHLRPPSSSSFQQTSSSLSEQFAEADRLLNDLQASTTKLQETLDSDRERVTAVVEGVEEATRMVKDGEEKWREEMREVRGEVESLRELVPRLIEKHATSQSNSLQDLQSELRSLKTLLQSRQSAAPASGSTGTGTGTSGSASNGISSTQEAANKLLLPKGKGIPAWQMASSSGGSVSGASTPSGSGSMSGSGMLEKEGESARET
ncbi:peroxisomal membrane anchor protein conserved region-domain-containing protein [Dioszegia hungarica]|uniref:Peroxisomal membrane protein PEX14 n=1 Tax=Dioszegia hungarica TaxID=4972 RepID=A0AA38H3P0_9TREE|nr:peroxisomal membrane anchor protein conserved region-domain-containing protein [Dioszegia hungarica]KAI9633430.1 peroxisomal membrane anchor protein conserved region-domain-containing protein [Dioszegia hungarica]